MNSKEGNPSDLSNSPKHELGEYYSGDSYKPNCKPGDLAIVVRTAGIPEAKYFMGRIVQVIDLKKFNHHGVVWNIVPIVVPDELLKDYNILPGSTLDAIEDCVLKPIDGGGISEEDVNDLYMPSPDHEVKKEEVMV